MKAVNHTPEAVRLTSQQLIRSLQAAVESATQNGIKYDQIIQIGGWKLKFSSPRQADKLPVLIHALPIK